VARSTTTAVRRPDVTLSGHEAVLSALANAGKNGIAPGELPGLSGVPKGSIRRHVRALTDRGLARRDSAHGRIYVTVEGIEAVADRPPAASNRGAQAQTASPWGTSETWGGGPRFACAPGFV
jgi:hypothetical protein